MMTIHEAVEYLEQRISWASLKGDYDIFIQGRKADDLLALLKSLEQQEKKDIATWIYHIYKCADKRYECGECHETTSKRTKYCPSCGLLMGRVVKMDD